MTNIVGLSQRVAALGAAMTRQRQTERRPTIDVQMRGLQNLRLRFTSNRTIGSSYRSVHDATDASTKLANMLFGTLATLFFGRWRSTPSVATSTLRKKSSKRHFGLSHLQRRK